MYVGDGAYSKGRQRGNEKYHGVEAVTHKRSESTELEGNCASIRMELRSRLEDIALFTITCKHMQEAT